MIQEKKFSSACDIYRYFNMPQVNVVQKTTTVDTNNLQHDTVVISNNKKAKKISKKDKIAATFIAVAIATLIANAVSKYRKPINFDKAHQYLSDMLVKNLTKNEAEQIIEGYKKILKIDKPEEFVNKLFEEVKKNFGYENSDIKLVVSKTSNIVEELNPIGGKAGFDVIQIKLSQWTKHQQRKLSATKKKDLFDTMHHEFKHIKQNEFAYRAEPEEYVESLISRCYPDKELEKLVKKVMSEQEIKKCYANGTKPKDVMVIIIKEECFNVFNSLYGFLDRFKKGSNEYKKGIEYINANKAYVLPWKSITGPIRYRGNLLEKEAFKAGDMAKQIFSYIRKQN